MQRKTYLVWIGRENYGTSRDYLDSLKTLGVRKKVPNDRIGYHLVRNRYVVFVAHDDGNVEDCSACKREIDCPRCRSTALALKKAIEELREREKITPAALQEASGYAKRGVALRRKKVEGLRFELANCTTCRGKAKVVMGSGGSVRLKGGRTMDYRQYSYWNRMAKGGAYAGKVDSKDMCENCGGLGVVPKGFIFGAFVASALERSKKGIFIVSRGKDALAALPIARDLVNAGVIPARSYIARGGMIEFKEPIQLNGDKRFRGVAEFDMARLI